MKRGRSRRMRTLPFWVLKIARLATAIAICGTVTVAVRLSTLLRTHESAQPLVREIALDREDLVRGHVHHLGVAADVAGGADRLAVPPVGDVRPDAAAVERLRALVGAADRAVEADAALRRAWNDHPVA